MVGWSLLAHQAALHARHPAAAAAAAAACNPCTPLTWRSVRQGPNPSKTKGSRPSCAPTSRSLLESGRYTLSSATCWFSCRKASLLSTPASLPSPAVAVAAAPPVGVPLGTAPDCAACAAGSLVASSCSTLGSNPPSTAPMARSSTAAAPIHSHRRPRRLLGSAAGSATGPAPWIRKDCALGSMAEPRKPSTGS